MIHFRGSGAPLHIRRLAISTALIAAGIWPDKTNALTAEDTATRNEETAGAEEAAPAKGFGDLVSTMDDPGPDLANFPNSSFTLKAGGFYVESAPLSFYGSTPDAPSQWNLSYLIRYGLFDSVELRLFSNGLTFREGDAGTSPLAIDTKAHLWEYSDDDFNASMGIEAYVQPPNWLASSDFQQPLQYSVTLLMDHELPWGVSFGWNLGVVRTQGMGLSRTRPTIQWSFQKNVTDGIALFIQGFHNASTLPGVPASQSAVLSGHQTDVVGFGGQWIVNERFSVFGNINWGVTAISPTEIATGGFAFAF
jgi:hypothetical protein